MIFLDVDMLTNIISCDHKSGKLTLSSLEPTLWRLPWEALELLLWMYLKLLVFIRIPRLEWRSHELALIANVCSAVMSTFDGIFEFVLCNQRMTKWRMIKLIYLDTNEKPFKCTCDASFARRDLLKRHQNLTHGTTEGQVPEKPSPSIPESSQQSSQFPSTLDEGHLTTQQSPSLPAIEPENLESYAGMTWSRTTLEVFQLHI